MQILLDSLTREQADTFGLVLLSSGIRHEIRQGKKGWDLWVAEDVSAAAESLLKTYLDENRDSNPRQSNPLASYRKTWSGVWGVAVLFVWHVAIFLGNDAGHVSQVIWILRTPCCQRRMVP